VLGKGRRVCDECQRKRRRREEKARRKRRTEERWTGREDDLNKLRRVSTLPVGPEKACATCSVIFPRSELLPKSKRTYCRECYLAYKRNYRRKRTRAHTVHTVRVPNTHQVCSGCSRLLPKTLKFFKPRSDRKGKLYTRCWSCFSKSNRERLTNATPIWLSLNDWGRINETYRRARAMKQQTGEQYEVDHIEPLNGLDRCGLHVPWNLRIVTRTQNMKNWCAHRDSVKKAA